MVGSDESIYIAAYSAVGRLHLYRMEMLRSSFYPGGRLYVEGKINENGMFSFDPK